MSGRPPFEPTQEQRLTVSIMAGSGFSHEVICQRIINHQTGKPLDRKTLEKVFREELDQGREQTNALVAQALFKKAVGGGHQSVTAAIFWLKCRAGWKPVEGVEVTGANGGAIESTSGVDEKAVASIVKRLRDEFVED